MNLTHLSAHTVQRLQVLRRRAWIAIVLCLLLRLSDATLHARSPADIPNHLFSSEKSQ
jgi:hypothetical protein